MDFIAGGQGHGGVAATLLANQMNPLALRPWIGSDDRTYIANKGADGKTKAIVVNNYPQATLRKNEWELLDRTVRKAAKPRLRAWDSLVRRSGTYNVPGGMGVTILQHQTMSDISPAEVSMSPLRRSERDRPTFDLRSLPLPIIHKDFSFDVRELAAGRREGRPIDTTTAELAGRRVAEEVEKLTLGVSTSFKYGGAAVYGFTNFPDRISTVLTSPNAPGWTPTTLVEEILNMKLQSQTHRHYGPWTLYASMLWDRYLDDDYSAAKGDNTLRSRIKLIDGINDIVTCDYLPGYQLVLVQETADTARAVVAMDINTVRWEEQGGFLLCFKVLCIMVPQLRSDTYLNSGIVHGVTNDVIGPVPIV